MSEVKVPWFEVSKPMLSEVAQSLQEARKMGRSIENIATSFIPLTDNEEVKKMLAEIQDGATLATHGATQLYNLIARDALRG